MLYAEIRLPVIEAGGADPYARFRQHQAGAKARGIEFEFTFEEWWAIWKDRFHERGCTRGAAVMCRTGDEGPYAHGNVRIDTPRGNRREAVFVETRRMRADAWEQSTAADWLDRNRRLTSYQPDMLMEQAEEQFE